jgi:DNA modification methylase
MKTTNLPIEKLIAYAGNPRRNDHAVEAVAAAIKRFGFRVPVLAKSDGTLIDGHLRIKAAKRLGMTEVPVALCDDLSEAEIKALRISINRMAELAEWDEELLMAELEGLAAEGITMDDVGFDLDALEALGMEPEGNPEADAEPQIDKAEELRAKWGVEPGQLWELGDHRLLCGDSTKKEDVERVMGGEKAAALVTDPPYGMRLNTDYSKMPTGSSKAQIKDGKGKTYAPVHGDDQDFDATTLRSLFSDAKEQFWFGADYYRRTLSLSDTDGSWIVWDKRNEGQDDVIGSGFELCWSAQKHQRRVLRHYWVGAFGGKEARDRSHPTQKPTSLICDIIQRWTEKGWVIAEPFSGSGTTIIACEQLGRKCRAIEISPAYVAVALQRWADATGKTPRLVP